MNSIRSFFNKQLPKLQNLGESTSACRVYNFFAFLGAFQSLTLATRTCRSIYDNFIRKGHNLTQRYGSGTWAVVTGATDDIGLGFAQELASRGFNICLIAQDEDKLKAYAENLREEFKINTQFIVMDFAELKQLADYEETLSKLDTIEVSILVNTVENNEGGNYHEWSYHKIQEFLTANINSQVVFSRFFAEKMLKREKKSAIITLASMSAYLPVGNMIAMYTAAKAFNHVLSLALSEEYRHKLDVMSVTPGKVANQSNIETPSKEVTPRSFAQTSLRDLGHKDETAGVLQFKFVATMLRYSRYCTWMRHFIAKKNKELYENSKQKTNKQ